jgi:hypothetical protein
MNEDIITDFKQFITSTIGQQISEVKQDIENLDIKLSTKIDDLSESVAAAISSTDEVVDEQLQDHDKRLTKLERKAA